MNDDFSEEMKKIADYKVGESLKKKILLILFLIIFAIFVFVFALSVLKAKAAFLDTCNWTEEIIRKDKPIQTEFEAFHMLGNFTNITNLKYEPMPLEYKCVGEQFYYRDTTSKTIYFVCKSGEIIRFQPFNCTYKFDVDMLLDLIKRLE